jgi:EAL domain-containing protein (putative c-di-GMP-specific phosphodiesterase class I)
MDRHEFTVHYQPIVNLEHRSILGVEALLRWQHPDRGLLHPPSFMEAAERSGLIVQLGKSVLQAATRQTAAWAKAGFDLDLAVNLSVRQLADPELVKCVVDAVRTSGLPPQKLWLEVTETALVEDVVTAAEALQMLVLHGARIAIDDFGTGWASLTYLKTFPVHALKIDRSFVEGIHRVHHDAAIIRSILSLAGELGLEVFAEGIETPRQEEALRLLGCPAGQGFLYDAAMPAEALTVCLRQRSGAWTSALPATAGAVLPSP